MKKEITTRMFFLLLSKLLPLIGQLLIIFIFSRQLSYDDYGSYQSIWLYMNILSVIGLFGLPALLLSTSLKNIVDWIKGNRRTAIPVLLLLNLLPVVYLITIVQHFSICVKCLLLFVIIFQNISIIIESLAIKNEREKNVVFSNIIFSALFFVWHLYVLNSGFSLEKLLPGLLLLYVLKSCLLFHKKIFNLSIPTLIITPNIIGNQWFYLGINDVLGVLFKWLDKWVILLMLTATQFAIYFNGAYEIPIFALMVSAVGSIMLVELSKPSDNFSERASTTFKSTSLLLASVVFPAFCFLLFFNQDFFIFFFGVKYTASIPVFIISIFILPVRIANYTAVLQVLHRNDLIVKGAVLDICIAIVMMLILYPILHERGIALAFVISTYLQVAYYLWHTGKLLKKKIYTFFPLQKLALIMLFSLITMLSSRYALILLSPLNKIMAGALICSIIILLLLLYHFKVDKKSV
ncbi:lipopolysaccharide biosynthesis protein [Ferruginibacter sp. SUN002]|uniref:lipopolysaccharide biosynthesis protein n=1 Tax=Ferruginibacter sp. SUN002 TaxID=2937789 RepID=UPI003D36BBDA